MIMARDAGMPIKSINFNALLKVVEKLLQSSRTAWVEKRGNTAVAMAIPKTPKGNCINRSL